MQFKRRLSTKPDVNLVPMIDVVFQLVIFFMVSSTFNVTPGISMALPKSSTSESVAMTKMVVTVKSAEEVYLNDQQLNIFTLDEALKNIDQLTADEIKTVVLEGDKGVSYELIIQVLDVLRKNNYKGINLKTRPGGQDG